MKIALTIQYDGSSFFGFQKQIGERTVQDELEDKLKIYFRKPVRVYCAGRTDTGVHATGQVVHFEIEPEDMYFRTRNFDLMIYNLNCMLPFDISISYGKIVPDDFHARFSCTGREYLYGVLASRYRMACYQKNHLWIRYAVKADLMKQAAEYLIGEHDFAAFTRNIYKTSGEKTVRRIERIEVIDKSPFLYFYFDGSGFLHNMIRIITGTLLMVGKGTLRVDDIKDILENKSRMHPGKTLPAFPLTFVNARYKDYETPAQLRPELTFIAGP